MEELEELREKVRLLKEWMELKERIAKMEPPSPPQYIPYPVYPNKPPYNPPYYSSWTFSRNRNTAVVAPYYMVLSYV